jgi:hypothetical protein
MPPIFFTCSSTRAIIGSVSMPDTPIVPLQGAIAPIFTDPAGVGVGVDVAGAVGVSVGTAVAVVVGVRLGSEVGVEVSSSPPPPQAGSKISSNKLRTMKTANQRLGNIRLSSLPTSRAGVVAFLMC